MAHIWKSQAASHRDGTVAIEYGLIMPVLLFLTFGIMETGRFFWTYNTLTRAAEAAARCGAVNNTTLCSNIPAYAVQQAWGMGGIPAATFTVTYPTCGAQPGVQVQATYPYHLFLPWFNTAQPLGIANDITITATACYPKQF
jgi:Flp pilus assembly protein TadG